MEATRRLLLMKYSFPDSQLHVKITEKSTQDEMHDFKIDNWDKWQIYLDFSVSGLKSKHNYLLCPIVRNQIGMNSHCYSFTYSVI